MKRNAEKIGMRCMLMAALGLLTALTVSWPCAEGQQLPPHYAMTALRTGSGNFNVYKSSGELVRTAVLALVLHDNSRELRGIFESRTLSTGPTLPVVITVDAKKIGSPS